MSEGKLRVSMVAQMKQGDLREAQVKRGWTQKQMAEYLGMTQQDYGQLLNIRWFPSRGFTNKQERKFLELTGKMSNELFPEWARQKEFLEMPKVLEATREVTPQMLIDKGFLSLPLQPDEELERAELVGIMDELVENLPPKYRAVIRRVFYEGDTSRAKYQKALQKLLRGETLTTDDYEGYPEDDRQEQSLLAKIERALRMLRHPSRSKRLKPFVK